ELVTEAHHRIGEYLGARSARIERAARFRLLQAEQRLARVPENRAQTRMAALLHRLAQRLDDLAFRQESALRAQMRRCQAHVAALGDAVMRRDPRRDITRSREYLADYRTRLRRCIEQIAHASRARHGALEARLHSLSPLAVLDRGYALVLSSNGRL